MNTILRMKINNVDVIEGALAVTTTKEKAKKTLTTILAAGLVKGNVIDEDGDIEETIVSTDLSKALMLTLYVDEEYFRVLVEADDSDSDSDSEDGDEDSFLYLTDSAEIGDWIVGKQLKMINGVSIDTDEIIAVRKTSVEVLEINVDNYIEANLSWIMDQLVSDYEEVYGEDDEDIDDGD